MLNQFIFRAIAHLPAFAVFVASFATLSPSVFGELSYSDGHADIGVAYDSGLELHWHMDTGAVIDGVPLVAEMEYAPDEVKAIVPIASSFSRGVSNSTWGFIGNNAGDTTYYLPEVPTVGVPYLGFGSEELNPADWTSLVLSWNLSLTSAPIGGNFSMFTDLLTPTVAASTFLGDLDFTTVLGGHSHFNMGFTTPGIYDVLFTVSGNHAIDGLVSDTQTYRFDVAAVPEPTSIAGALALGGAWVVNYRRRRKV